MNNYFMKKYLIPAAIMALIVAALYFYQPAEQADEAAPAGFTEDYCLSLLSAYTTEQLPWETAQSKDITWKTSSLNFQYKDVAVTAEFAHGTRNSSLYICKVTMYAFQDIPSEGDAYFCDNDAIYKLKKEEKPAYLMLGRYMKTQEIAKLTIEYISPDARAVYDSAVLSAENEMKSIQCA